jgi:hypothetical protein
LKFAFRRLLFVTEISFLGSYEVDWEIGYEELKEEPILKSNTSQIQILTKVSKEIERKKGAQKKTKYLEQSQIIFIIKSNRKNLICCRRDRFSEKNHFR